MHSAQRKLYLSRRNNLEVKLLCSIHKGPEIHRQGKQGDYIFSWSDIIEILIDDDPGFGIPHLLCKFAEISLSGLLCLIQKLLKITRGYCSLGKERSEAVVTKAVHYEHTAAKFHRTHRGSSSSCNVKIFRYSDIDPSFFSSFTNTFAGVPTYILAESTPACYSFIDIRALNLFSQIFVVQDRSLPSCIFSRSHRKQL